MPEFKRSGISNVVRLMLSNDYLALPQQRRWGLELTI